MKKEYRSDAGVFSIGVTKKELKILTFWADIALKTAKGGYQYKVAKQMVTYFKKHLK